jgi:hypothetical protein
MHFRLPSTANWGYRHLVQTCQDVGGEDELAEVGPSQDLCIAYEVGIDIIGGPEMQPHVGLQSTVPILVALRERPSRPQDPIGNVRQNLLGLLDRLHNPRAPVST